MAALLAAPDACARLRAKTARARRAMMASASTINAATAVRAWRTEIAAAEPHPFGQRADPDEQVVQRNHKIATAAAAAFVTLVRTPRSSPKTLDGLVPFSSAASSAAVSSCRCARNAPR